MNFYYKSLPWIDPEAVFESLFADKDNVFWLDSNNGTHGFSYMGEGILISNFQFPISNFKHDYNTPFLFQGGYVGYLEYEGQGMWLYVDKFLVFDHKKNVLYAACVGEKIEGEKWAENVKSIVEISKFNKSLLEAKQRGNPDGITSLPSVARNGVEFSFARGREQYLKDIELCKDYLEKGESYQICLTNKITTEVQIDSFTLYKILRKRNPAAYSAYLRHGNTTILSSSPEKFLTINKERWIETKPIKGTIKRSDNNKEDERLKKTLLESKKNRAENIMITDLLRNDLGKVCELGSVLVSSLLEVESYKNVHHLVSTIRGKLKKNISVLDCIKACFPGGSMTGAPKKRTMEILKKIEKEPRGVYSGTLGFISLNGCADLNIVIRTIVKKGDVLSIGTGGAILFDSNKEEEFEEMLLKAEPMMQSIQEAVGAKEYQIT